VELPADISSLGALAARSADGLAGLARASAWVRGAGLVVQATLALAGVVALTVVGRAERAMSGLGGALAGALAALALRSGIMLHLGIGPYVAVPVAAVIAGAASAALPRLFPFLAAALPGALVGLELPIGGRPWAGALALGLAAGFVAAAFARGVGVTLVSLAGGLALAVAGAALFAGRPWAAGIAERPLVLCGLALVLGIAGAAYQLPARPRGPGSAVPTQPLEQPARFP
jgi:hypothetical protein